MNTVYVLSFATKDFEIFRQQMQESASRFGLQNFISYNEEWLQSNTFYLDNQHIFKQKKGFGFWLWKPFCINECLKVAKDGDIIFYIDSGSLFIDNPKQLINIAKENNSGIVAFDCRPLTNHQWTKRDAFINMGLDKKEFWYAPHVISTVCLFRKSSFVVKFVKEWLDQCTNTNSLTDADNIFGTNLKGFIDHRHDQSLFSLLIGKYYIETYRNPSAWGNYLKLPEYRENGELVCFPYLVENTIKDYSDNPLKNSPYGTIFEFNRKQNQKLKVDGYKKDTLLINSKSKFIFKLPSLLFKTKFSQLFGRLGYEIHKKNKSSNYKKCSFSQCGEDLLIQYLFSLRGLPNPTYIDIGANHPYFLNNTALFYKKGCRGINIEANPYLIEEFYKERPNDINLNIGIGSIESELEFIIMNDPTLSSFSEEESQKYINTGKYFITERRKIKTTTINKILESYRNGIFPDLLSIDVEGMDFDILKTIDYSNNSPKVICVEAADYSPIGAGERRAELIEFLIQNGYYEYANTNLNSIMVKRDFWFI